MHGIDFISPLRDPKRYSAKKMAKPVNFRCVAPSAANVQLLGDFNGWDPSATPMQRQADGAWFAQVSLNHGHHTYRFLVDGQPTLDPKASGVARDPKGEKASLISVS
jgi:1,4-alpha-glucan branching enzyme